MGWSARGGQGQGQGQAEWAGAGGWSCGTLSGAGALVALPYRAPGGDWAAQVAGQGK